MTNKIVKYNPSFLTDQELFDAFVVRQAVLELLLDLIRENTGEANQHCMVIGPRGSGKTTLLRRAAVAVKQTPELADQWFPLSFGEESYEVTSIGEFWLEALHHMGVQTKDPVWDEAYEALRQEPNDQRLALNCQARLLDFADEQGKRLLLLVENINLMLGEQVSEADAWALRKTLMHEPRFMLLGSATSYFDAITDPKQAMYELFRVIELERLSVAECQTVWSRVTGKRLTKPQARAVQILTGGNPRLLTILAAFGAQRSFRSLLEDLSLLVDEHTDYFKSNFESLPVTERKVFACLATLWEDSPASAVAKAARMTTSQVSAMLKRLETRGAVRAMPGKGRGKRYQLAERLYNIYYLMRRDQRSGRVKAVVDFMVQFYGHERLHEAAKDIAAEACGLTADQRHDNFQALRLILQRPDAKDRLGAIRAHLPEDFLTLPDMPDDLRQLIGGVDEERSSELEALRQQAEKAMKEKQWEVAETTLRKIVEADPDGAWAVYSLGGVLGFELNRPEEGVAYIRKAVALLPEFPGFLRSLGFLLVDMLGQYDEGAEYLRKAVALDSEDAGAWKGLGEVLVDDLGQHAEGVECLRKAIELEPKDAHAWGMLGKALAGRLGQPEEGADCLHKAVDIDPDDAYAWATLGRTLADDLGQIDEGVKCLHKATELAPEDATYWGVLGEVVIEHLAQPEEGLVYLQQAAELAPEIPEVLSSLGNVFALKLGQYREGAEYFRRALALEPENAPLSGLLGFILYQELAQFEEAALFLKQAVALDSENAFTWGFLGDALLQLDETEEAVDSYRKAVALNPEDPSRMCLLGALLLREPDTREEGRQRLRDAAALAPEGAQAEMLSLLVGKAWFPPDLWDTVLECVNAPASLLNALACSRMDAEAYDELDRILDWARRAADSEQCAPHAHGTYARALALAGRIPEALEELALVLEHPDIIRLDIQESTTVLAAAAALGHGHAALELLEASPSLPVLEPLAAGLRLYLKQELHAPQEVKEVGEDVVARIEEWKQWHAERGRVA